MPQELIIKTYDAEVKAIEGERALNVTITTPDVDRDGDIVEPKGAKLVNYRKNPVVLMAHDYRGLPIGKAKDLDKTDTGINAKVMFPEEGTYPLADTVYNMYKQKFMKAWSIGFIPIKTEDIVDEEEGKGKSDMLRRGKRIKSWELLEFSACAVPSNPHALTTMVEKGINIDTLKEAGFIEIEEEGESIKLEAVEKPYPNEHACRIRSPGAFQPGSFRRMTRRSDGKEYSVIMGRLKGETTLTEQAYRYPKDVWPVATARKHCKDHKGIAFEPATGKEEIEIEEKGVIPYKETPKAPEGEAWDAGKEVRQAEISDLKIMCTWFDSENPDIKGAYKLPHHKAKGHAVVWRGVATGMAVLLGARGGVAVPADDKKGIYNHLVKHYKQFDKDPPEFRDYDEAELKELFPEEDKLKEIGLFDVNELYEMVKESKELKLKVDELNKNIKELELKAGAVLNAKNKQDLKNAQKLNQEADALIQGVLDSAETNEDSLEIEDEKDSKSDDPVIKLEGSKGDDIVTDEGIDEAKLEEIIEKTFEENNKNIKEHFNKKLDYITGRVK